MDGHCDCAEPASSSSSHSTMGEQPPPPPPPSGKLNKAAFKLFKRRKPSGGGAMPSIFGVRSLKSRGGDGGGGGGGGGPAAGGLVRSKTHDGLAEVAAAQEGGKKAEEEEEEDGNSKAPGSSLAPAATAASPPPSPSSPSSSSVGKSHSFFSLLRKKERPSKGRGGLKGLFSSMRWPRRDKPGGGREKEGEEEAGETPEGPAAILMPGSLTASLECIKEEAPPRPPSPPLTAILDSILAPEAVAPQETPPLTNFQVEETPTIVSQAKESHAKLMETTATNDDDVQAPQEDPAITGDIPTEPPLPLETAAPDPSSLDPPSEPSVDRICLMFADVTSLKSFDSLTGCGDIIADPEDDAGGSGGGGRGGGGDKSALGVHKEAGASKKPPGVVTYQGGGEEMASPEQVGDTCAPEFWDLLSRAERKTPEMPRRKESPEASKDGCAKGLQDEPTAGQHVCFNHSHREEQKSREKEQQEAIPSSDEGYWDSTTPGPEEDSTNNIQKEVIPRDSYSGDALYDLYTDPDENTAAVTSAEDVTSVTCGKPLSPVTTTCVVKTHTTSLKDSKIPISIKHFTSPHSSHGPDTSNSHHIAHHQPTKSEVPRTKIPVSKVLVHRASYRSLAGTTGKAATYHESAKK